MNSFQRAVEDIFKIEDFIQYFEDQDNNQIVCISYHIDTNEEYSMYGYQGGVGFYITCKTSDYLPKRGNKITFRGTQYKIQSFITDEHALTYNIYLKSISSK